MDVAEKLKTELESKFSEATISIDDLGPVIGAHLGPRTLGVVYY